MKARVLVRVLLGLVVASSFVQGTVAERSPAGAQTGGTIGGLQGRGAASGFHVLYAPEGVLPISPLVDIGIPDALATIASGPSTFARASIADPGDLIANPGAVIALLDPSLPADQIPAYPFRIAAASGIGAPSTESNPAPGLNARVNAESNGSSARATMPLTVVPGLASAGSIQTSSSTSTDGSTATVTARTVINDLNILGVIRIDSIVTDVAATSSGAETALAGGTTLLGATVLDQQATIDANGIHIGGPNGSSNPILGGLVNALSGGLNELLARAGIRVTLIGPAEQAGGSSGQLSAAGLRLDLDLSPQTLPALGALLDALPPIENPLPGVPSIEDLLTIVGARHLATVEFARASVSLSARPPTSPRTATPPSVAPPAALPSSPAVTPSGATIPPSAAAPVATPPVAAVPAATEGPQHTLGTGIGAIVLLALLASLFVGDRLARFGQAVLAPNHAGACTREEP